MTLGAMTGDLPTGERTLRRSARLAAAAALWAAALLSGCAAVRSGVASAYGAAASLSPLEGDRLAAPHGIEPVCVNASLAYLVPVDGGVVLVDTGFDESGAILEEALRGRLVLAVLLTHGHLDHRSAAHRFEGARVYVGRGDVPWMRNERPHFRALFPHAGRHLVGAPPLPGELVPVGDGARVEAGGATFVAVALPGHTPGSTAWRLRDVLFTGDAVVSPTGERLEVSTPENSEDLARAKRSLRRLVEVPFSTMLDGHYGRTDEARALLPEALGRFDRKGRDAAPAFRPLGCAVVKR